LLHKKGGIEREVKDNNNNKESSKEVEY